MADLGGFDDPGPLTPLPPSRIRRALTIAVLLTLVVSMVFLAWISGRGEIRVVPIVPSTPTAPPAIAATSRLAVIDDAGHLVTTDAVGGSPVSHPAAGVTFTFPAWSSDGSHIAAIGQGPEGIGLYVFATTDDGGAAPEPAVVYQSADRPPFYLYWAPDGERVTFLTTEPDGLALRIAPADARTPAVTVRQGAPMYWTWVDGGRILIHSGADGVDSFVGEVAATDGMSVEPAPIAPGGFRAPGVTADGRYRAFVAPGDATSEQVVVAARDGSSRYEVQVFGTAAIDFSPTGHDLAFIAPDALARPVTLPVGPLRIVAAETGQVRTILAGSIVAFFWAPDGRTLAALQIGPPGGDGVARTGTAVLAATAAVPPGLALRLVFVDAGSGAIRAQRAVRVTDAFVAQLLPYFDQYALSHQIWSSDSASIVLPVTPDDGTGRLLVVPADGSDAREIAGSMAFWSPSSPR